jgi:hypothetical protein
LELDNNLIGKEGGSSNCRALKINSKLNLLNMGNNSIEKEGAIALAEALRVNSTLKELLLPTKVDIRI